MHVGKLVGTLLIVALNTSGLMGTAGCIKGGRSDDTSRIFLSPEAAAQAELDVLRKLDKAPVDPDDTQFASMLGFASVEETADSQLGAPFRICSAPLKLLQTFQAGDDPRGILVDTHRILFPILVNGQGRSSLTVEETGEKPKTWQVTDRGRPRFIRLAQVASPTLIHPIQQQSDIEPNLIVYIAGLRFLGEHKAGELVLTSIEQVGSPLNLRSGQQQSARTLFSKIKSSIDVKRLYETEQRLYKGQQSETLTQGGEKC